MNAAGVLVQAFDNIRDLVPATVEGLSPEQLVARLDEGANPIGWLVWHLSRVQDSHVAEVAGREQVWTAEGWVQRFGLPYDASATGFGQSPAEVAAFRVGSVDLLLGYHDAVHDRTVRWVRDRSDGDLDRIVDENWDPPVTLGVRLLSVIGDDLQHVGQAAYVRGVLERRT
ncbi:MAG: hypothetical protein QOI54_648 [Actinomycetota bacterium]|jgi:hypothetical protein|nr:hypothetical protein [Actinomycetota bacterium]